MPGYRQALWPSRALPEWMQALGLEPWRCRAAPRQRTRVFTRCQPGECGRQRDATATEGGEHRASLAAHGVQLTFTSKRPSSRRFEPALLPCERDRGVFGRLQREHERPAGGYARSATRCNTSPASPTARPAVPSSSRTAKPSSAVAHRRLRFIASRASRRSISRRTSSRLSPRFLPRPRPSSTLARPCLK